MPAGRRIGAGKVNNCALDPIRADGRRKQLLTTIGGALQGLPRAACCAAGDAWRWSLSRAPGAARIGWRARGVARTASGQIRCDRKVRAAPGYRWWREAAISCGGRAEYRKGEAAASPLFGAVKLLVNSRPAISEQFLYLVICFASQLLPFRLAATIWKGERIDGQKAWAGYRH